MNKFVRPLLSSLKNAHTYRKMTTQIITNQTSQCIYVKNQSLVQKVSFTFSQQKGSDPNESLKKESQEFYQNYV